MKMTEKLLAQLTETNDILEAVYEAIATLDPNHREELEIYYQGLQALKQAVPDAQGYILALRKELASDVRYAMWQGFQWNLQCFQNPVNKLLLDADFDELYQESRMSALPESFAARQQMNEFLHSAPEGRGELLKPIIDHFSYLKTWGYKAAFFEGFCLADKLLPHLLPGYIPDTVLSMCCEKKLRDSLGVDAVA